MLSIMIEVPAETLGLYAGMKCLGSIASFLSKPEFHGSYAAL